MVRGKENMSRRKGNVSNIAQTKESPLGLLKYSVSKKYVPPPLPLDHMDLIRLVRCRSPEKDSLLRNLFLVLYTDY